MIVYVTDCILTWIYMTLPVLTLYYLRLKKFNIAILNNCQHESPAYKDIDLLFFAVTQDSFKIKDFVCA